jgi:hypothetical protein
LPFGPANAVTLSAINASITANPALTAKANSPSRAVSATSAIATLTTSGITSSGTVAADARFFW